MSFDRPGPNKHQTVSDTEVNEALEHDTVDQRLQNVDRIEHEEGQRSPGPVENEGRRPPRAQDVSSGDAGKPVEPPD